MHAVALHALRTASRKPIPISRSACRIIAGSRHSLLRSRSRGIHSTAARWNSVGTPVGETEGTGNGNGNGNSNGSEEVKDELQIEREVAKEGHNKRARSLRARFRANRERGEKGAQSNGLPAVEFPRGYWERCVLCEWEARRGGALATVGRTSGSDGRKVKRIILKEARDAAMVKLLELEKQRVKNAVAEAGEDTKEESTGVNVKRSEEEQVEGKEESVDEKGTLESLLIDDTAEMVADIRYTIHEDVYNEIHYTLRGGLALRPPKEPNGQPIPRTITLLQTPQDGAIEFLDSVVETVAQDVHADLIRLDAQDFAETLSNFVGENLAWDSPQISALGYETARVAGKLQDYTDLKDFSPIQDDLDAVEEEEDPLAALKTPTTTAAPAFDLKRMLKTLKAAGVGTKTSSTGSPYLQVFDLSRTTTSKQASNPSEIDHWANLKINTALEKLIMGADEQRASKEASDESHDAKPQNLIVQIQDYKEINSTKEGAELLTKLRAIIDKKWQDGRNIICVGTTASQRMVDAFAMPEIQQLQADSEGETRTIYVPTEQDELKMRVFEGLEKSRTRSINARQIEEMILRMSDGIQKADSGVHIADDMEEEYESMEGRANFATTLAGQVLETLLFAERETLAGTKVSEDKEMPNRELSKEMIKAEHLASLEEGVWTHSRVRRLVSIILGECYPLTRIGGRQFNKAMDTLTSSDEAKVAYGKAAIKADEEQVKKESERNSGGPRKAHSDKIRELSKTCTAHEKKMLKGIVLPKDIKTSFADIRAPPETIEALKTLTGLSLSRPEAFSYGVLATDKIPGLLLYGPPGTGKTLLAKAVAKESGATVLEISGADVNDMYVGEGEKNVKAVFSLAKKLSPCIVFIDEADAIFAARGAAGKQRSHRELINQFLREWDGMRDMKTFIMIATNRPFDLDDAVLRRLPRKLLVDLPLVGDREAILKIHLKDEILDPSVSLENIAKDTPFYSGSDLKNVAVAAALACIREENAMAAKHEGEEAYVYPEKRTLRKEHFTKALEEISASVSEDMSTLGQIRKFDERYGDRKGRRKKGAALGFGGTTVVEKDSEAARVRKLEA